MDYIFFLSFVTDPILTLLHGFTTSSLNYCGSCITETSKSDTEIFYDVLIIFINLLSDSIYI